VVALQYGVLICFGCHDYRRSDLLIGSALLLTIPMHLFIAYTIEVLAARQATRLHDAISKPSAADQATKFRRTWILVAWAHFVNASAALAIASTVVYFWIHHPLIGTSVELHAIIVWLKTFSYALTNRDLRHAYLHPSDKPEDKLPELYAACSYPRNISIGNLCYFWWAPTLVYQPVYPRTPRIRKLYVLKRLAELATLSIFIWILTAQYAAPLLRNSLLSFAHPNPIALAERTMKLSTISLVTWLAGFFALFQSALNALAEVMRFADRDFYADWWNAASVGAYWRMWNKPVYTYMKRHVFSPLRARGCSPFLSSFLVFFLSAVLHELLVGVPTHMFIGVAFLGMMAQLPLIALTEGMERWGGRAGKTAGNCVFWVSFVLVGQPLAALIYFFAWEARFGGGIDHLKAKGTAEVSGWTGGWGSLFR
jgi:diacylglycerol O-acyltransferase-1